ncbi:MAG: hypothetical protein WBQ59_21020, partial [Candidatus Acidiferrum sp.]
MCSTKTGNIGSGSNFDDYAGTVYQAIDVAVSAAVPLGRVKFRSDARVNDKPHAPKVTRDMGPPIT